jgi:plastocyanin
VTLVARGVTFTLAEQPDIANPIIRLRAGERVRLILRNEAPGLLHDIVIPAWDVAVDPVRTGQTAEVTFAVPATPGRTAYRCRPHGELMNGVIEVLP